MKRKKNWLSGLYPLWGMYCFAGAVFRMLMLAASIVPFVAWADEEMAATADPIPVDLRTGKVLGVVGAAKLRYSPRWTDWNASVRIEAVSGSTTNIVMVGGQNEEGVFAWAQPDAEICAYRLLLWTLADGVAVGEPLTAMVSFAFQSSETALATVDTFSDSLQDAATADATVDVALDAQWFDDAVRVELSDIVVPKGQTSPQTNELVSAGSADGHSSHLLKMKERSRGVHALLCKAYGNDGESVGEILSSPFSIDRPYGTVVTLR